MNTSITTFILGSLLFIAIVAIAVLIGMTRLPHLLWDIILLAVFYAAILAAYFGFAYHRAAQAVESPWWPYRITILEWAVIFIILTILWALARPAIETTSPHRPPTSQQSTNS